MKKELVIIAGSCYPINSATGGIALKCAEYLDEFYNIRFLAIQEGDYHVYDVQINNFRLYTLSQWRLKWAQRSKDLMQSSEGIRRKLYKLSNRIARAVGRIQSTFFTIDNMSWYKKRALSLLKELDENKRIDTILSFCMPIESHFAAETFKNHVHDIRWISYWGDLFAAPQMKLNIFMSISKMKKIQRRLISNSNAVLCTQEICSELVNGIDDENLVITPVPYVMKKAVIEDEIPSTLKDGDVINFVYMGSFYKDIRNPELMLKLFLKAPDNYRLHLYSTGNCEDIIDKYAKKAPEKIIKHRQVPADILHEIMKDADVLVNVENSVENTNPSKLIDLISYRKPIVDFTYYDVPVSLLAKYPCFANINSFGNIEDGLIAIHNLIERCKKKGIMREQILELYSEYTEEKARESIIRTVTGMKTLEI